MGDQKTRETRSPPKAKELSLDHDRRDDYGENNKSKRKNIPLFKAQSNRRGRHGAKVAVNAMTAGDCVDTDRQLLNADKKAAHPFKTKSPDKALRKVLEQQGKRPNR